MDHLDPKVQKLKKRILNSQEDKERYQQMYQRLQDRIREILDAKDNIRYGFWCGECEADVSTKAMKIIRQHTGRLPIAWYVGFCPAGHRLIRRITDKRGDRYYAHSLQLRRDRLRHRDDLLTPNDARFWLLYGHKHGMEDFRSVGKLPTAEELKQERGL